MARLRELEDDSAEDVGGERLLSLWLLECLLPVDRRELEDAISRPAWDEAEQISDVSERLDFVEATTREERYERGIGFAALVAAHKQPIAAPYDLAPERELAGVVVDGQASIVQESQQGLPLIARVAKRGGHGR